MQCTDSKPQHDQEEGGTAATIDKAKEQSLIPAFQKCLEQEQDQEEQEQKQDQAKIRDREGTQATWRPSEFWMRVCLRVKGYNLHRALASYKAYAAWRREYEVNQRALHTDEQLLALVRHGVVEAPCFQDRQGHRVIVIRMARADPSRWTPEDAVRCVHIAVEYAFLRYPLAQRRGLAFMIDMRNISTRNMDIRVPRALLAAFSNHLPLRFGAVYLINPPLFMRVALNLVKAFLKRKLQSRIHIVKGDVSTQDGVLKYFERHQLPVDMNGSCVYDHANYTALLEAIHTLYPTPERFLSMNSFDRHPPPARFEAPPDQQQAACVEEACSQDEDQVAGEQQQQQHERKDWRTVDVAGRCSAFKGQQGSPQDGSATAVAVERGGGSCDDGDDEGRQTEAEALPQRQDTRAGKSKDNATFFV